MRPIDLAARQAVTTVLAKGPAHTAELLSATGVPQRTIVRALAEQGGSLVSAGKARRRRHALRRALRNVVGTVPVYAIDAQGKASVLSSLDLIRPEGSLCPLGNFYPVADEASDGWWDGLPYPLHDMRPQGYIGRLVAQAAHEPLGVPADPREWDDDAVVSYLERMGSDCSGNMVIGDASLRHYQAGLQRPTPPLAEEDLATSYADYAQQGVLQAKAGSSAGGEFPKFTVLREGPAGAATPHAIVKFSGADTGATTRRWASLLVCEHLAVSHAGTVPGVVASTSRILTSSGRTFLESERFDRIGRHGRRAMVSLQSASDHLLGLASAPWPDHAAALATLGFMSPQNVESIRRLWWFGRLTANTDMHLGNLALFIEDGSFTPAPAFDVLPMRYAPLAGGEVPPTPEWTPPLPLPPDKQAWMDAYVPALAFWREAADDERVEPELRTAFESNASMLEKAAALV